MMLPLLLLVSAVTFFGGILSFLCLIWRMEPDYFVRHRQPGRKQQQAESVFDFSLFFLRNVAGLTLFAAGVLMLLLPGEGILTMLAGLILMDFPGKHRMLERAVRHERVRQTLNWLRRKGGKEDLIF